MLNYIIQTVAFQLFFLIIYDLFLKKETFFNWNRAYLLATSMLSVILPFIKIDGFKNIVPQDFVQQLPQVFIGEENPAASLFLGLNLTSTEQPMSIWSICFLLGICVTSCLFIYKILRLRYIIQSNPKQKKNAIMVVLLLNSNAAFSFFNYVFLGEKIDAKDKKSILKHEIIHVKQKHTLDLLYFEMLRVLFWFNPLIYLYQHKISALHEYIADAKASTHQNKKEYYQNLLSQTFETQNISFINTFFKQSLIKKRIVMLSKTKSKQIHLLKYTVLLPLVAGMLIYTSCNQVKAQGFSDANVEYSTTPLLKKIKAMKQQMEIQGHSSEKEQKGFDLLLKVVTGTSFDAKIVEEVHAYTAIQNKTPLMQKIADVFEQIQIQGNISEEEEKALKTLLMLITENGLSSPLFQDVVQYAEIPFGVIDQVPVYPGCEDLSKEEQKKCMTTKVSQHILKNFNTKAGDSLKLTGRIKIYAIFKVSNKGQVEDIKVRAAHKIFEDETKRVINLLPKMKPGEHKGKAVNVPYSIPIIFEIKE